MRLIDADALVNDVTERYCKDCERRKGIKNGKRRFIYDIGDAPCRACGVYDMIDDLENAPTVDPVKHGHWVEQEHCDWVYSKEYRCSECGKYRLMTNPFGREWNYCPNCGAKMDGVEMK